MSYYWGYCLGEAGKKLSKKKVETLVAKSEAELLDNPSVTDLRVKLIAYYATKFDDEYSTEKRLEHLSWFLSNMPEHDVLLYHWVFWGLLSDTESFKNFWKKWLLLLDSPSVTVPFVASAGVFIVGYDFAKGLALFERAIQMALSENDVYLTAHYACCAIALAGDREESLKHMAKLKAIEYGLNALQFLNTLGKECGSTSSNYYYRKREIIERILLFSLACNEFERALAMAKLLDGSYEVYNNLLTEKIEETIMYLRLAHSMVLPRDRGKKKSKTYRLALDIYNKERVDWYTLLNLV